MASEYEGLEDEDTFDDDFSYRDAADHARPRLASIVNSNCTYWQEAVASRARPGLDDWAFGQIGWLEMKAGQCWCRNHARGCGDL